MSQQLLDVLKAQRRRRRMGFWLGFFAIFAVGGLWAQLSKDAIGPNFIQDFGGPEPAMFDEAPAIEFDAPTTTVVDFGVETTPPPPRTAPETTAVADTAPETTAPTTATTAAP